MVLRLYSIITSSILAHRSVFKDNFEDANSREI